MPSLHSVQIHFGLAPEYGSSTALYALRCYRLRLLIRPHSHLLDSLEIVLVTSSCRFWAICNRWCRSFSTPAVAQSLVDYVHGQADRFAGGYKIAISQTRIPVTPCLSQPVCWQLLSLD